ncbi:MAG: SDR family oxidoreductase [Thermoleophilia bacterium]
MRVFVTGGSGFIGSAVVPELLAAGHAVSGLARSDASAGVLDAAGVEAIRGDLEDLDVLARAAAGADAIVHCAFVHDDFSALDRAGRIDLAAVETFGDALAGSGRALVITSGTGLLASGRLATEDDRGDPASHGSHRLTSEVRAIELAERGVRSAVVRLPPTVHGEGDHGFVPALIDIARRTGVSGFPGDGANRWPAVHRRDAARLFRLAAEGAPAGAVLHGVAEEGITTRTIAEAIGRGLGVPVRGIPDADAADHFGWLAGFFSADVPASSVRTRALLPWVPTGPGLLDDLDAGHYFPDAHPAAA